MDRKVGERERRCDRKGLILGRDKIDDELDWTVKCKGCGELYVLREVVATLTKRIRSNGSLIRDRYGTLLQDLPA